MRFPRTQAIVFCAVVTAFDAAGQQPKSSLPAGHPELGRSTTLEDAAALTEALHAGRARPAASPVARVNLIDDHILGKIAADRVPHSPLASDEEFCRRIHLDLIGRIPEPDQLESFVKSTDKDKREKLIDSLLSSEAFFAKWSHWWLDLSRSVGGIVGAPGRNVYYDYMFDAFQSNRPYDRLVTDLLTTDAYSNWYVAPATFLVRSRILAPVNTQVMHEDSADEMTVNSFRLFLGVNLQCVSCHDGRRHLEKMNLWLTEKSRREFWAQAAFFGKTRIFRRVNVDPGRDEYGIDEAAPGYDGGAESVVRIKRTGQGQVEPAFILTGEKPAADVPLRKELARMVVSHPQFARATVNLFWSEFMGAGLVDPVYDFDLMRWDGKTTTELLPTQATHPQLLEALAEDFRKSGYDLRRLFKTIVMSSAYQLSSQFPAEWKSSYAKYFSRKFVRRLTAEQIHDSIVTATGRFTPIPVKASHITAKYLTQIRCPEDINTNKNLRELHFFVETFGQANRRSTDRSIDSSITQAVLLLNSAFVRDKMKAEPGSHLANLLAKEKWSDDDLVDRLFARFLARQPSADEKAVAKELMAQKGQRKGGEELQWALMNKVEFLFNN